MANYKRRKRRKGGIKGCCGMCCLATTDGRRNGRKPSMQERRANLTDKESLGAVKGSIRVKDRPLRGSFGW